jgi:hypothetical protein
MYLITRENMLQFISSLKVKFVRGNKLHILGVSLKIDIEEAPTLLKNTTLRKSNLTSNYVDFKSIFS